MLNQLFINSEPAGRSMSAYFDDEIAPKLQPSSSDPEAEGDNAFLLRFDGLRSDEERARMHHISQPPTYWFLYHAVLPLWMGWNRPFTDLFAKQLCPSQAMDAALCPVESLKGTGYFLKYPGKFPSGNWADWDSGAGPADLSRHFEGELAAEMMSASGVGSAHSVAKAGAYMLFSGEVLQREGVESMVSERVDRFDVMLGMDTSFSRGGVHHWDIQGVHWHGWGGWGGSLFVFSVEHEAVIAFSPTAFNSPHYSDFQAPRPWTIMNLVSQQLLSESG